MRFEKWQALGNDYVIVEAAALPWELTAGAGPAALRAALRGRLRRRPAALAGPRTRATSPSCGSSTPTARRPSSRATAPARRRSTCAARAGPTRTSSRSSPRPGEIAPHDHRAATPRRLAMGRASTDLAGLSLRRPTTARGTLEAGGRRVGASSMSRSATRSARSRSARRLEELDLGAIGPEIERSELFPNRTNVSFFRVDGCAGPRADLRARGGGDALLRHRAPAAPRSPPPRGAPQPDHGRARRGRARGRGRRRARRPADRHGRAGVRGRALAGARCAPWPRRRPGAPGAYPSPPMAPRDLEAHLAHPRAASRRCRRTCSPSSSGESPTKKRRRAST